MRETSRTVVLVGASLLLLHPREARSDAGPPPPSPPPSQRVKALPPRTEAERRALVEPNAEARAGVRLVSEKIRIDVHPTLSVVRAVLTVVSDSDRRLVLGFPSMLPDHNPRGAATLVELRVRIDGAPVRLGYDEWRVPLEPIPGAYRQSPPAWTAWWTWETRFAAGTARTIEVQYAEPKEGLGWIAYPLRLGLHWPPPGPEAEVRVESHDLDLHVRTSFRSASPGATIDPAESRTGSLERTGRSRIDHRLVADPEPWAYAVTEGRGGRAPDLSPPSRGLRASLALLDRVLRAQARDFRLREPEDRSERERHWTKLIEDVREAAISRDRELRSMARWVLWSARAQARQEADVEEPEPGSEDEVPEWLTEASEEGLGKRPRPPSRPPMPLHLVQWLTPEGQAVVTKQRDDTDCGSEHGICIQGPRVWPPGISVDGLFLVAVSRDRARVRFYGPIAVGGVLGVGVWTAWLVRARAARRARRAAAPG